MTTSLEHAITCDIFGHLIKKRNKVSSSYPFLSKALIHLWNLKKCLFSYSTLHCVLLDALMPMTKWPPPARTYHHHRWGITLPDILTHFLLLQLLLVLLLLVSICLYVCKYWVQYLSKKKKMMHHTHIVRLTYEIFVHVMQSCTLNWRHELCTVGWLIC